MIAYTLAIAVIARFLGLSSAMWLGLIILCTSYFEPLHSELRVANVGRLQLAMLAIYVLSHRGQPGTRRAIIIGFLLGLAVMFKPNLSLVALCLALQWILLGRSRTLLWQGLGGVIAGAVAVLVSSLFFGGVQCWAHWLSYVGAFPESRIALELGNYGIARLVKESIGVEASALLLIVFLLVIGLVVYREKRRSSARLNEGPDHALEGRGVALGCLLSLLVSPLVWIHYYILMIPPIMYLLRPIRNENANSSGSFLVRRLFPVVAIAALSVNPFLVLGQLFGKNIYSAVPCLMPFLALFLFVLIVVDAVRSGDSVTA